MAIDYQIPQVLPHLFYLLAHSLGVGPWPTVDEEGQERMCHLDLSPLHADELRTLLLGSYTLRTQTHTAFPSDISDLGETDENFDLCSAEPDCCEPDGNLDAFWRRLSEYLHNGWSPWTVLECAKFNACELCRPCRDAVHIRVRTFREDMWSRLPELLKLVSKHHIPFSRG